MPNNRFAPEIQQAIQDAMQNKPEPLPGVTAGPPRYPPPVPFVAPTLHVLPPRPTWEDMLNAQRQGNPNIDPGALAPPNYNVGPMSVDRANLGARIIGET